MPRDYRSVSAEEIAKILDALGTGVARAEIAKQYDIRVATVGTFERRFSGRSLPDVQAEVRKWNKYKRIFRAIFDEKLAAVGGKIGDLAFTTDDIARTQAKLQLEGGNPYDIKYNSKGRGALPEEIQSTAPKAMEWRIKPTGKGKYIFKLYEEGGGVFDLDPNAIVAKVPEALPMLVERYARNDEQALLARIRYNQLISMFLGLTAYSLQSHWKTASRDTGSPMEIDEMYVGLDSDGSHYVIPVEAKGRKKSEKITAEQLLANFLAASNQFQGIPVIPVAAKVMDDFRIALIRFDIDPDAETVEKAFERHYVLSVNPPATGQPRPILSDEDIQSNVKFDDDDAEDED